MLHLSLRDDVEKVMYIEPPLNLFRLVFFSFSELKTPENRNRWSRALQFKVERSTESKKLFIFTPVFFIPFAYRIQFIYNLNLYISLFIIRTKLRGLEFDNIVLWLYHPFDHPLVKWFKNRVVSIFDWAEDWAEYFTEYSSKKRAATGRLEEHIIKDTDIVFLVSTKMLRKAKLFNKNSHYMIDGTVHQLFQKKSDYLPNDLENIRKPIIGYTGTIGHRVDIDLLERICRDLTSCSLILIGNVLIAPSDIAVLKSYNNIYFLGGKDYNDLGRYMQHFNVSILPYKPELTSSFPTKLLDYFAAGKPVVSTNLIEIQRFKDIVWIASSNDEFVEHIRKALSENSADLKNRRISVAENNSWAHRAEEIMGLINKGILQ